MARYPNWAQRFTVESAPSHWPDGDWRVMKGPGGRGGRVISSHRNKGPAIERAKETARGYARRKDSRKDASFVVVERSDGTIQDVHGYGRARGNVWKPD